jgi:glycosyltransferase involved in cell wall biosynthesis
VIIPSKRANYTEGELRDYCETHQIRFQAFPLKYRFRDPRVIATYLDIIRAIKKADPDLVYFTNFDQVYINLLLLLIKRKKMIIGFHDVENHSNTRFDYLTNIGKNVLFKRFGHFLTYSESQAALLKKRYPVKKVYTVPLPLIGFGEPIRGIRHRDDLHISADKKMIYFLFFGNILFYKGLDILLQSIDRLSKKYDHFRLVIAGRSVDNWEEKYEPLVKNKQVLIKEVRFIENNEIAGFFDMADYVILPYRDTTQSGPLMISYHYNVPVIASNAIGFREFIQPGTSGYMFDLAKENDLDRALEEALHRPREEYLKLKADQKKYVEENFSIESIVRKYENMFNDVYNKNLMAN